MSCRSSTAAYDRADRRSQATLERIAKRRWNACVRAHGTCPNRRSRRAVRTPQTFQDALAVPTYAYFLTVYERVPAALLDALTKQPAQLPTRQLVGAPARPLACRAAAARDR